MFRGSRSRPASFRPRVAKSFAQIKGLKTKTCPFANLPEAQAGRWGQGLTAEKMKGCIWVKPEAGGAYRFRPNGRAAEKLRHTKYAAMRDDKDPRR